MSKKMLIDATHPEETRVVVVDGNKVDDFDFESINKRQLAGNIYLAKVTRVEPSLQAAFVDYGGNRHGFLAFNEIHPDYYQIPVADREALIAEEAAEEEEARRAAEKANGNGNGGDKAAAAARPKGRRSRRRRDEPRDAEDGGDGSTAGADASAEKAEAAPDADAGGAGRGGAIAGLEVIDPEGDRADAPEERGAHVSGLEVAGEDEGDDAGDDGDDGSSGRSRSMPENTGLKDETVSEDVETATAAGEAEAPEQKPAGEAEAAGEDDGGGRARGGRKPRRRKSRKGKGDEAGAAEAATDDATIDEDARGKGDVDEVGAEDVQEEVAEIRRARRRRYKIQDVVKVRQIMLVQVVKEERGNKGAALTTYLSLAGRYCVLMPNTARGGGISRKITQVSDRKRLREVVSEFEVPKGMGLIVRTAGAERTRAEIKRDYEFLLRQWEQIRELTLRSIAPTLIYEEGSLIKRVIRDLYSKEIDAILVEGEAGYREAKSYMKMLMPSHAKNVQQYQEAIPLFIRYQVESYLNAMFNPTVQLKSGGYIVIGTTEALVAIDVNSGRSTREGSIEETALKTNLEAADEVARQLRLRDLAGLIVIDFIDMDESRNNRSVEKRIKDRLKTDRARIQVGRISAFGLMEMSRQRLRPGMLEATTQPCPHCHGQGIVRSEESLSLAILRELEEEGVRGRSAEVALAAPVEIVNFLVNHKRKHLNQIEERYGMVIMLEGTPALTSPNHTIERSRTASRPALSADEAVITAESAAVSEADVEVEVEVEAEAEAKPAGGERERARAADGGEDDGGGRRRRGKRGGRRRRGR
ncbi:MAG TPA: Rne/Rng family ribonuclease, partial [Thermohalobaculum sp.]|nr:Rne/Rng family ribonuclease [Thermohalobaculum sp.]